MADYGLIIRNNNQEIQIDSKYRNLSKDQEGYGATISNGNTSGSYYTEIPLIASPLIPLILIRPNTDHFVAIKNYVKSGNNFVGAHIVTEANKSTVIDWKAYRENRTPSSENHGLRIYNPNSELVFDSGKEYFKVHSVHTINLNPPQSPNDWPYADISHPEISDPFYVLAPNSWFEGVLYNEAMGVYFHYLFMVGVKKLSAISVRVGWFLFGSFASLYGGMWGGLNPPMTLLVCEP